MISVKVGLRGSTQGSKLLIVVLLACRNDGGMHLYIREVRLHHIPVNQIFFSSKENFFFFPREIPSGQIKGRANALIKANFW